MKTDKEYIIEVYDNCTKKYFCINRFLGEISYSLVDEMELATKLDKFQIKYDFPFLRDKDHKAIKIQ